MENLQNKIINRNDNNLSKYNCECNNYADAKITQKGENVLSLSNNILFAPESATLFNVGTVTPSIKLSDISMDVSVFRKVNEYHRTLKKDFNPYWDEDGNFHLTDQQLLPLNRLEDMLEDNRCDGILQNNERPPILLTFDVDIAKYKYSNGRHRHARLLIINNLNGDKILTPTDYVIEKNPGPNYLNTVVEECKLYSHTMKPLRFLDLNINIKKDQREYFIYDVIKNSLTHLDKNSFRNAIIRVRPALHLKNKILKKENYTLGLRADLHDDQTWQWKSPQKRIVEKLYKPQIGFMDIVLNSLRKVSETFGSIKSTVNSVFSSDFYLFILDVLRLVIDIREGFLTFGKFAAVLISLYTLNRRFHKIFTPQATTLSDVLLGFSLLGMPTSLIDQIKNFSVISGKRIFDMDTLYDLANGLFTTTIAIIKWFGEPTLGVTIFPKEAVDAMVSFVEKIGGSFLMYGKIKEICTIYSTFMKNSQIMFDPAFRQRIMELYNSVKGDEYFLSYVANTNNKYFSTTWQLFKDNIVKMTTAFEESRREEPICIVFEGKPGSGKSVLMNNFVDLLRTAGKTIYCHSIPASEDGKDFYDDYQNQEVFVIDDIGQQGKSQWRYIINFVSPVKYPLPCATASLKNTKFFNSKIILCTTNCLKNLGGFTSSDCIESPEALYRRCHVIEVKRGDSEIFKQILEYNKFDFNNTHSWKQELLDHNKGNLPMRSEGIGREAKHNSLFFVYNLLNHLEKSNKADANNSVADEAMYKAIIDQVNETFEDAVLYEPQGMLLNALTYVKNLKIPFDMVTIFDEWLFSHTNFLREVLEQCTTALNTLCTNIVSSVPDMSNFSIPSLNYVGSAAVIVTITVMAYMMSKWFTQNKNDGINLDMTRKDQDILKYMPQNGMENERIDVLKKHCKTIIIKEDKLSRDEDLITQAIVSGDKLLLPYHLVADKKLIDVYTTFEHFKNSHKEMENVTIELVKSYPTCDLAVYKIVDAIPLWKLCKNLFPEGNVSNNPLFYLVNSQFSVPVIYGSSVKKSTDEVKYAIYRPQKETVTHKPDSGYITPLSDPGMCGTVLATSDGGIVAYHVAGTIGQGFCVEPSVNIRADIRSIMLDCIEPTFEIDTKICPNISGARLRYSDKIDQVRAMGDSSFVKTVFHRDVCPEIKRLEERVYVDNLTSIPVDVVDHKGPPNFRNVGTPSKLLKKISQKSFKSQGYITMAERSFIKECIKSMLIKFDDIEDDEVAFGNDYTQPLNKDSSNGFGCLKNKSSYFDFENKIIKSEAKSLIDDFEAAAIKKDYNYNLFTSRESFKDELRKSTKLDEPRTFRVMPLGHIWWTKKIFAKLIPHFKENMLKFGICVGLNPYKDFEKIEERLKTFAALFGDADFGKWDGSIMSMLMTDIGDCFKEFYTGKYEYVLDFVMLTMSRSFVAINDELWATTHGLPSGTWLTLLLNSLLNKALTALVIYRNMENPTLADFQAIIDFVMGDDKLFGTPEKYRDIYNLLTIREVSESLGMDCTNGDKSIITKPTQEFSKLSFVKRHFRYHPVLRKVVGVLSIDTIMNTLQWYDSSRDLDDAIEGKMRSVQVESFLHSPALFEQLTSIFKSNYPMTPLFNSEKIIEILSRDDGYKSVMTGLGKDMSFML
jgi:hypothetical protein